MANAPRPISKYRTRPGQVLQNAFFDTWSAPLVIAGLLAIVPAEHDEQRLVENHGVALECKRGALFPELYTGLQESTEASVRIFGPG